MTSDLTHQSIINYLAEHDNFQMQADQIIILKQISVPLISNIHGDFDINPQDPFKVNLTAHGHGDIHQLLYNYNPQQQSVQQAQQDQEDNPNTIKNQLLLNWKKEGYEWVVFLEDIIFSYE